MSCAPFGSHDGKGIARLIGGTLLLRSVVAGRWEACLIPFNEHFRRNVHWCAHHLQNGNWRFSIESIRGCQRERVVVNFHWNLGFQYFNSETALAGRAIP